MCCGWGRHLQVLLESGLDAYGFDLSWDLLTHAESETLSHRMVQADMRAIPFRSNQFDFIFSFFTSFGYFPDDDENRHVLSEMKRCLKPGASLLLDYLNPLHVRAHLVPEDEQILNGLRVHQTRYIDEASRMVIKTLTIGSGDEQRQYHEKVKLYEKADFERFFAELGLSLQAVLGNADGDAYDADSPRMILIGQKDED